MKKTTFRYIFTLFHVLLAAAFLFAVSFTEASSQTTPIQKARPQYGGTLKIISKFTPVNLGIPYKEVGGDDATYNVCAVETLLVYDRQGKPIPWLATGWKVSKDRKTLTLLLRKGVKFHDGMDFNAEAVKYLLDQYRTSGKAELKTVSSVDIIDNYTVNLVFSTQFEDHILNSLGSPAGQMVSPTALKNHDEGWAKMNPVGTGPFKMVKHERDTLLRFEKFPGYWQKGKPYLDAVEFYFIIDPLTALVAFKRGDGDEIMRADLPDILDLQSTGKYIIDQAATLILGLAPDGGNPKSPFADVRVRKAVEYAIDKDAIANGLFRKYFPAATQVARPGTNSHNPTIKGDQYNPNKAKQLLTQAGYPNGFTTKLYIRTTDDQKAFVAIQSNLKTVGIDVVLEPVSPTQYAQITNTGWENSMVRWHLPTGVGMHLGQAFLMSLSKNAVRFKSLRRSAAFEDKLAKAVGELDERKSKALYQKLTKIVNDEAIVIPFSLQYFFAVRTPRVHNEGAGILQVWGNTWTPADAWLSK